MSDQQICEYNPFSAGSPGFEAPDVAALPEEVAELRRQVELLQGNVIRQDFT